MNHIKRILEYDDSIKKYLLKRRLLIQYKRMKDNILSGDINSVKLRQPKKDQVYYFRINKQFRAYCRFENGHLIVVEISNHQNG